MCHLSLGQHAKAAEACRRARGRVDRDTDPAVVQTLQQLSSLFK
jgi:hypothetical protein